jgi:3-hydroxypropanoate dehydrogenase
MKQPIAQASFDQLFLEARTFNTFTDQAVGEDMLRRLYDVTKMGPTSANSHPMRVLFVQSAQAKAELVTCMQGGNANKVKSAPVTAVIAWAPDYFEQLPRLFPPVPNMRDIIAALPDAARERQAMQSANLAAGYFILAARALGLDCAPMGGIDADKINSLFFAESKWRTMFVICLGYGDPSTLFPRGPRLDFDEACNIL